VAEAVEEVEKYLSFPLTEKYYDRVKDNLFHDPMSWEEAQKFYDYRGAC
jgi:hypothetical protein